MKKRKKLKIKPLRGILSLLVLAVVVFAAFVAVKCDGDLSWDNIERTVRGLRAGVGQTDGFEYESSPDALFADLGGGLLRLTGSRTHSLPLR